MVTNSSTASVSLSGVMVTVWAMFQFRAVKVRLVLFSDTAGSLAPPMVTVAVAVGCEVRTTV